MKQTCPADDLDFLCPQCGLVYGQYKGFFKLGIKSTCLHCTSSIEAGVLYGGYDAERDRFYWKEFTFHHYLGECGLPGPFPGRTSRQWQATIDEPIFKIPGGIQHEAYEQLLNHCGATADFMLHRHQLGLSGKLLRGKPTISTLLMKARAPGSGYSTDAIGGAGGVKRVLALILSWPPLLS